MLAELHRRRVFRTVALYIVSSWLLLQVADVLFPALDIPEQAVRYVLYAAILGLPVALVFAWFFDVGAHGIRRTAPASDAELETALALQRRDFVLLTVLAGVVVAIIFSAAGKVVETPVPQTAQAARPAAGDGPPMVAVLPFAAADEQDDGELFAAGVHDDLLTQLAKLESLRVISRTSVLEYKDTARNLRDIGLELGADVILEGFVRVAGSMIRINAQLIDTRTDAHLWAETYDRDLTPTNIFQVQEDIARAISLALNTELTAQDEEQLAVIPTENMAAYRAYRRAMTDLSPREDEFMQNLKQAVALDPGFVRAWAELVGAYAYRSFWINNTNQEYLQEAELALQQARSIAPDSAEYLMAQTFYLYYIVKDFQAALGVLERALAKMPSDIRLLEIKTWIERRTGDHEQRLETIRKINLLDPRNMRYRFALFNQLFAMHRYDAAWEQAQKLENLPVRYGYMYVIARDQDGPGPGELMARIAQHNQTYAEPDPMAAWMPALFRGDYEEALRQVGLMETRAIEGVAVPIGQPDYAALLTYWLMQDSERLAAEVAAAHSRLDLALAENPGMEETPQVFFARIMLAALEGEAAQTLRLYQRWEQRSVNDWTERMTNRGEMCMLLAISGNGAQAAQCLRKGIREPSFVVPFIEPYLPFYDQVRDTPEFAELLAEIEATAASGQ